MIKIPAHIDGVDYTTEGIRALRDEVITWRDEMVEQEALAMAMAATHVTVLLAYLVDLQRAVLAHNEAEGGR